MSVPRTGGHDCPGRLPSSGVLANFGRSPVCWSRPLDRDGSLWSVRQSAARCRGEGKQSRTSSMLVNLGRRAQARHGRRISTTPGFRLPDHMSGEGTADRRPTTSEHITVLELLSGCGYRGGTAPHYHANPRPPSGEAFSLVSDQTGTPTRGIDRAPAFLGHSSRRCLRNCRARAVARMVRKHGQRPAKGRGADYQDLDQPALTTGGIASHRDSAL
jgi:hypothetical protein